MRADRQTNRQTDRQTDYSNVATPTGDEVNNAVWTCFVQHLIHKKHLKVIRLEEGD